MNTLNSIKIYAVISVKGQWGSREEYVEKCFVNFDDAVEYAICIDQSYQKDTHSPIPENIINDILDHWEEYYVSEEIKFIKENSINIPKSINEDFYEFLDKLIAKKDKWCLEYLLSHYKDQYSEQDWIAYLEWKTRYKHSLDEVVWLPVQIREFELVVPDDFEYYE